MIPEATGARGYTEDPPSKRPKPTGEEKGECLSICIFAEDDCTHRQACRFFHKKPMVEAGKGVIRAESCSVMARCGPTPF